MTSTSWSSARVLSTALLAVAGTLAQAGPAEFLDAPGRRDIAYDPVGGVLYISAGSEILRWSMGGGGGDDRVQPARFLRPIAVGGTPMGMDISPDGLVLAVANASLAGGNAFVTLIDLGEGDDAVANTSFPAVAGELGTYAVAYDAQGALLVSSTMAGGAAGPLRKITPSGGGDDLVQPQRTVVIGTVPSDSMLSRAGNGALVGVAEGAVPGKYGQVRVASNTYLPASQTGRANVDTAVAPSGGQQAVVTNAGTVIKDKRTTFPVIGTAAVKPLGAAYNPVRPRIFFPMSQTNYIAEYATDTYAEVKRHTVPGTFDFPVTNKAFVEGRVKVASDGSYLFATVDNGVHIEQLLPPPVDD